MALFLVERTVVAVVDAPDARSAESARFRSGWEASTSATPLVYAHQIPEDWRDYPPIDVKGQDVGTTPLSKIVTHRHEMGGK